MNKAFLIILIVALTCFSLASCGKKGRLEPKEGFNYPRVYPTN